jgi:hypothetical protein
MVPGQRNRVIERIPVAQRHEVFHVGLQAQGAPRRNSTVLTIGEIPAAKFLPRVIGGGSQQFFAQPGDLVDIGRPIDIITHLRGGKGGEVREPIGRLFLRRQIDQPHRAVLGGDQKRRSARIERGRGHFITELKWQRQRLACARVPNAGGVVLRKRGHPRAVRTEHRAVHRFRMLQRRGHRLARGCVPHPCGVVP